MAIVEQVRSLVNRVLTRIDRQLYRPEEFVVVSNNCWGAEIYRRLGKPYNTPFVGLAIWGPDYLKLLQDFDRYMDSELTFTDNSQRWPFAERPKFPVGLLDGELEILFIHYGTEQEAYDKWTRRTARMKKVRDKNRYFYKYCDRDDATSEMLRQFHRLPFKNKVSFGVEPLPIKAHYQVAEADGNQKMVVDGKALYRFSFNYLDVLHWITTGEMRGNAYSKVKAKGRLTTIA